MNLDDTFRLAMQQHRSGELKKAEQCYRRLLKAAPNHPDVLHYLGVVSHQLGRGDEAVELIRRAIRLQPDYVAACNNLGNVLKEKGALQEAEATYRKVIGLQPRNADAYNNLGVVLKAQEHYPQATEAYRHAIELEPEYADAWHNLGGALKKQGKIDEALTAYRRAILIKPGHVESYKSLGRALYANGRAEEAVEVYRQWLRQDPGNLIAEHMLAACSGQDIPQRASDGYVQETFDTFSETFDQVLRKLDYRAPALVADSIRDLLESSPAALDVLDAGCGTGLCGDILKPCARRLLGLDLSPGMLAKASGRDLYDELVEAELTEFLSQQNEAWDLIVSADTLCYFGVLEHALNAAVGALRSRGRLVFTVERAQQDIPGGFRINPHGRYSHSEAYVRQCLSGAGLDVVSITVEQLRKEAGQAVDGLVVIAQKGLNSRPQN